MYREVLHQPYDLALLCIRQRNSPVGSKLRVLAKWLQITNMLYSAGFILKIRTYNAHKVLNDISCKEMTIQLLHNALDELSGHLWDNLRFKVWKFLSDVSLIKQPCVMSFLEVFTGSPAITRVFKKFSGSFQDAFENTCVPLVILKQLS